MSLLKSATYDLDFFLLLGGNDENTRRNRNRVALAIICLATFIIAKFWLNQVTKYVPEPYLDEVFHIPQSQAYCRGDFHVWDPKLTTPAGLYMISTFLVKYIMAGTCTVVELRMVSCVALIALFFACHGCKGLIMARKNVEHEATIKVNWNAIHTAFNICLFPPLFFFSGLHYTDVVSTCIVIGAYYHFLNGGGNSLTSIFTRSGIYVWGILALLMRQTNIFWVAVFFGGLETVRTFKTGNHGLVWKGGASEPVYRLQESIKRFSHGELHDPPLQDANVFDFPWCSISIAVAAVCHPVLMVKRLWPYVALLFSFGFFVLWNGGVVLGDKSNHVATIHLPQMLYIWPFFTFFSFPLFGPYILAFLSSLIWPLSPRSRASAKEERPAKLAYRRQPYSVLNLTLSFFASLIFVISIIHFNTIIHPFILADNRHYIFYVFRYTIRRQRLVKYALGPIYVLCGWLTFQCLSGLCLVIAATPGKAVASKPIPAGVRRLEGRPVSGVSEARTSFAILWLLSTALSLITAPLVEPRYFIVPWVIWRLHVPAIPPSSPPTELKSGRWLEYLVYRRHDLWLWVETLWFLVINMITGYIFLFKGFEWAQEPGVVQRFMW